MARARRSDAPAGYDVLLAGQRADLLRMRGHGMALLDRLVRPPEASSFNASEADRSEPAPADARIVDCFGTLVLGLTRIIEKERQSFAPLQRNATASRTEREEAAARNANRTSADERDLDRRITAELDRIAARRRTAGRDEADCLEERG